MQLMLAIASLALAFAEDFGQLGLKREHIRWPSPESVLRRCAVAKPRCEVKALLLVGVPEKLASEMPEQIMLRYAALGHDATQQAALMARVAKTYAFADVVVRNA